MIKAVIFDVDDTLYSYTKAHPEAFGAVLSYAEEQLKISPETFRELHQKVQKDLKAAIGDVAAVHNRMIRYQRILESQGLPLHPHALKLYELYWGTLMEVAEPSPGASEMMRELKERGIRIGIGTDMTAYMQFRKLESLGLMPYVDFFVCSEEAGVEKPHPAFFSLCAAKAGCERQECLFVGDTLKKDVLGPMEAGLKAVWYCPDGRETEEQVLKISHMEQLPGLITELG